MFSFERRYLNNFILMLRIRVRNLASSQTVWAVKSIITEPDENNDWNCSLYFNHRDTLVQTYKNAKVIFYFIAAEFNGTLSQYQSLLQDTLDKIRWWPDHYFTYAHKLLTKYYGVPEYV